MPLVSLQELDNSWVVSVPHHATKSAAVTVLWACTVDYSRVVAVLFGLDNNKHEIEQFVAFVQVFFDWRSVAK